MTQPSTNKLDWELDFFSRQIIESDGKKRWDLLITSTELINGEEPFRFQKICPSNEVNSIWLTNALREALKNSKRQGLGLPKQIKFWRASMKSMIKKAAENLDLEIKISRRTYSLYNWIDFLEKEVYPKEKGFVQGVLAPNSISINSSYVPQPLPEAIRGDALSISDISIEELRFSNNWPIEFKGLIPIPSEISDQNMITGLRLFSKDRSLALSAWLGGLEPVKLLINKNQLILEAGEQERWLVTDLSEKSAMELQKKFEVSNNESAGLQFISVQATPYIEKFDGFWLMKDFDSF
tara:strand:- start:3363 stop:4247 length:885 start_codon:yes stop_codon:yes gene_type:complete